MVLEISSPSMKQEDMDDGGSESSEADAISHSKEGAERERPIPFVGIHVKLKVGVDNAWNVILLAHWGEEPRRKDRECLGLVDIEPVADGCHYIHDDNKSNSHIGSGEPRAGKWASKVGGNSGPVEAHDTKAEPGKSWAQLLGQDGGRENPTYPREGGQHGKEVAGEDVVGEAAEEGDEEKLIPRYPTLAPLFLLM